MPSTFPPRADDHPTSRRHGAAASRSAALLRRHRVAALTGILGALAAGAAPASAAEVHTYDVKYVGKAAYHRVDAVDLPHVKSTRDVTATITWTELGTATFRDRALATSVALGGGIHGEAREQYDATLIGSTGTQTRSGSCTGAVDTGMTDRGLLQPITTGLGPALQVVPFARLEINAPCTGDIGGSSVLAFPGHGDPLLTARFTLPRETIGMGKIVQLVEGDGTAPCPMRGATTVTCEFTWDGQLTFVRTDGGGAEPSVQPPPPGPQAGTSPPADAAPAPVPAAPRPSVSPAPAPAPATSRATARLLAAARGAGVRVACPAACRGTVEARVGRRRVARARFSAAAGGFAKVTVRFGARARRSVRKAGAVRIVVRAADGRALGPAVRLAVR